jgi:membrane protein implicated in regulation of membrane protease activity
LGFLSLFSKKSHNGIVGERCVVVEQINPSAGCGEVKVKGQIWAATGVSDNDVFEEGENLKVVAMKGAKLICKK